MENTQVLLNIVWTMVGAFLVYFMQAGFAMVETGFTRAKNSGNILMKNMMDFVLGSIFFFIIGFALMFGSSHFGTAEKEFRFPLAYGNQRPPSASWTVTGSGACVLGKTKSRVKITGATTGKIIDYGLKDNQNMGACMAPAACDTIAQNLVDFNREPADYDRIVTGDLGVVGREILLELLKKKGYDISEQHSDCGMLIFDPAKQDTGAGGSGCGCAASVLAEYLLPKLENGEWKRILFVPTGALMSKVSFQEGSSVPGIAQAVVIEREEDV